MINTHFGGFKCIYLNAFCRTLFLYKVDSNAYMFMSIRKCSFNMFALNQGSMTIVHLLYRLIYTWTTGYMFYHNMLTLNKETSTISKG